MKKSFYLKFEDIPEADRADYVQQGDKWVLQLDGQHPIQIKNAELLTEKQTANTTHQTTIAQKDAEIQRLQAELNAAKSQPTLPAGQVAVSLDDLKLLNEFKALGDIKDVKAKVDEHKTLKEQNEANQRKTLLAEAAKAHGFNEDAFVSLAEVFGLAGTLESRDIDDGSGGKIKHFFVKHKDANGVDTATVLTDYVKNTEQFKPFLPSLEANAKDGKTDSQNKVKVPTNGAGKQPENDKSAATGYINRMYKKPAEKS